MDARASNITHGAAAILGIAIREIEDGTIRPRRLEQLRQARAALRSLCVRCVEEDKAAAIAERNTPPRKGERNE